MQDAAAYLLRAGGREDCPCDCAAEQTGTDEGGEGGLVTGTAAGYDADLGACIFGVDYFVLDVAAYGGVGMWD